MKITSGRLDLVVNSITIRHQMMSSQPNFALEDYRERRMCRASGARARGQHGKHRLRLNWMNIFLWGSESENSNTRPGFWVEIIKAWRERLHSGSELHLSIPYAMQHWYSDAEATAENSVVP